MKITSLNSCATAILLSRNVTGWSVFFSNRSNNKKIIKINAIATRATSFSTYIFVSLRVRIRALL